MKAITGVIVELEGSNQQITKRKTNSLGYLEDNIEGGGLLSELADNERTLKAKLRAPAGDVTNVSVPSPNVMKIGDVISVVQDDDGCEFYYENHSSDRTWTYSRCPAHERRLTKWARIGINWGLFGGIVVGLFAGFAQGQSMGLNLTAGSLILIAVVAMIWTLTGRPRGVKRHLKVAKDLVQKSKTAHSEFIRSELDA